MMRFSVGFLPALLLLLSSRVFAVCIGDADRLRGEYALQLPSTEGTLLRVRQPEEELVVHIQQGSETRRFSHPGGAGIDHYILPDITGTPALVQLCLFARYGHSQAGTFAIEQIPLTVFSSAEVVLLRNLTNAAELWAEDRALARNQALAIYSDMTSQAGSAQFHAIALLFEAVANMRRTKYTVALERLEALTALLPTDSVVRYKAQWKQGEANLRINRPVQAATDLQQAINTIETELNGSDGAARRDLAEIRLLLAEAHLARRDLTSAQTQIDFAIEGSSNDHRMLGKIYNLAGYVNIIYSQQPGLTLDERRKFLSNAIDVMLAGRFLSASALDTLTLAAIENNLGFAYDWLGEYRRALIHYGQILEFIEPDEDPLVYRFTFNNLGRIYQTMADYPRSESYYRRAISLVESSSGSISTSRCALGTTMRLGGDVQSALVEHGMCLHQAELIRSHAATVLARYELAEDHLALGDETKAWSHLQRAWEQSEIEVSALLRTRILRRYAWLLQRRGVDSEANNTIYEALTLHRNMLDLQGGLDAVDIVENFAMAMQISLQQGDMAQAEKYGLQAIELIEAQYEQLESERQGPAWSSRTHDVYVLLAEIYLQTFFAKGDETALLKAFNITERSRAASLRQQFVSRMQMDSENMASGASIDDSISRIAEQTQIELISRIANEHAIVSANASKDNSAISLPTDYYHHQDVLSLYRLQGITHLPLPPAHTLADIQARLQPEQAVLYYLMAEKNSYVFTVASDTLTVSRLPDAGETGQLVTDVRKSLADANASPYHSLAQLSERLLVSLEGIGDKKELLIVPHGALHALPFSALPLPEQTTYQPLVSRYAVQVLPSLTAYLMDKPLNVSSGTADIAIFADPIFDALQLRQQLAALDYTEPEILRNWSNNLERLPNTAIEAQNLAQLFTDERTILLTGERATRANLAREDIRNARVLHIATHGYFNAANDDNVGLGFSVIDENGNPDTGFVTLPELFSYRFNNELVVISGCDTAMGRPLAGEGMMGLTRGFIAQGAGNVISTLWPVSDRASADFMAIFYRQLLAHGHVARALQAAQTEMQQNPDYRNPFYWAAYVLTSVSPDQEMSFSQNTPSAL